MPRPRKKQDGKITTVYLERWALERVMEISKETGLSLGDLIEIWLTKEERVVRMVAEYEGLKKRVIELEKEKQALLEEREKLLDRIEKLQFKLETYEKGKGAVSSRSTKIINALVKVIEEDKTFADTMIEIGIEHPQEQLAILKDLFITKDEYGNIASVFYPLKTLKRLQGWVLVKGKEPGMLNYVWHRESTLKVAEQLKKAKAQFVVNVRDDIKERLSNWADIYERFLSRDPNAASEYLLKVLNKGLPELIKEYSFETVEKVILSNPRFSEIFGSLLPSLKKKAVLEVKA